MMLVWHSILTDKTELYLFGAQAVDESQADESKQHFVPNKRLRNNSRTIVTRSAIFSFRNGLIMAKMPLKILGSFMMLTALILIGNPSCESEERRNRHRWSLSNVSLGSIVRPCKYSAVTTTHNKLRSGAAGETDSGVCRHRLSYSEYDP